MNEKHESPWALAQYGAVGVVRVGDTLGLRRLMETELSLYLGPQASVPAFFAALPPVLLSPSKT